MSVIARIIAALMLFGALGKPPSDYYVVLRYIVFGVAMYSSFIAGTRKAGWAWTFRIIGIIFIPFVPERVFLARSSWAIIDITAGILLLASITFVSENRGRP